MSLNSADELLGVAPGENKIPQNLLTDDNCKELAFPNIFPTGEFGYKVSREFPLSAVKYFNQRLLNFT